MYLSTSPVVSHQRLKLRGRSEEANVTLSYLQDLDRYHQDWLSSVRQRNEDDEDDVPVPPHTTSSIMLSNSCLLLALRDQCGPADA